MIKSGKYKCFTKFFITLIILVEVAITIFYNTQHGLFFNIFEHLQAKDVAPHSVYDAIFQTAPMYSWTHRQNYIGPDGKPGNRTIIYSPNKNPTYARRRHGYPVPTLHDTPSNTCLELVSKIQAQEFLPEYVVLYEFTCAGSFHCKAVCFKAFDSLGLYELEKRIPTELELVTSPSWDLKSKDALLYKLKPGIKPF